MSSSDVQKADADLWLAYAIKLRDTIAQSSTLGPNDRFYIAPLSSAGIAAGSSIAEAIQNNGVYNVGDSLLSPSEPVFLPSRQSYFQRCQSYVNSIALQADNNLGAEVRYKNAQKKQNDAQRQYLKVQSAAHKAYGKDPTHKDVPFGTWVTQNYPTLAQAQQDLAAATAALASAASQMNGPKAAMVGQYNANLQAANSFSPAPGLNMNCSTASADQIADKKAKKAPGTYLRPMYQINTQYAQIVDSWIATYPQNKAKPTTMTFKLNDATKSSWGDLGFSSSNVDVNGSYCMFFTVTYTENNSVVTKNVSAAECGSDLEITVTTTGQGAFDITPGNWNPSELLGMPIQDDSDPNLSKPMAFVNKAFLAYGVGMQISLSAEASSTINNYLEKARKTNGSASIFGYNIGLGGSVNSTQTSTTTFDQVKSASTGTTITIPPADNAYPTLMAVFGQDVPLPGTVSAT